MMSEREQLACLVQQWNENRLELFHLSYPTEELEIEGVMRFYFQDGQERVLTKCVRVSSTATTRAVVEALSDKFLPDLKMLSNDTYSLWEVHENGEERRLDEEEKPLLVQLMWHRDDREGRFLLRRDRATSSTPLSAIQLQEADARGGRFSKKKEREVKKKHHKDIVTVNSGREEPTNMTDIYKQVPFNTFTRTISNPEAVMRKRREKKLETKLKDMVYGGSLKVFGGDIVPSRPYVTILAGLHERADRILTEALEKYGLEKRIDDFILVEVSTSSEPNRSLSDLREANGEGRIVAPDECPLLQMAARAGENGFESYLAIKHRPSDYQVPANVVRLGNPMTSSMISSTSDAVSNSLASRTAHLPTLTLIDDDGTLTPHRIAVREGLTEVGSDRDMSNFSPQNIYLEGPEIRGRHAAISFQDGIVTVTPSTPDAYIAVNQQRLMQTEVLRDGDVLRIGADNVFKFACGRGSEPFAEHNGASAMRLVPEYANGQSIPHDYPASLSGSSVSSSRHPSEQLNGHHNVFATSSTFSGLPSTSMPVHLPISLQIGDYKVWDFLGEVMSRGWADCRSFRLAPAYALYLALRFFQSHTKAYLVQFFARIEANLKQIATECSSRDELLFWLANASELGYLVDRDPKLRSPRAGKLSAEVEHVFRRLCTVLLGAIRPATRLMLDTKIPDEAGSAELISLLDNTMRAARTSRLNAALTIQISGHMLHTVNAYIFNHLVGVGVVPVPLTTRLGKCLQTRLAAVHRWAEVMGVELAAECHLDRSRQAAALLAAQKNDVASLGSTCYKLNSLQVMHLLSNFEASDGEIPCDGDVVTRIMRLAEKQADQLTREDGLKVSLEEPEELTLPFLIPQDGYTSELLQDVPEGLTQYLLQLEDRRVCHSVSLLNEQQQRTAFRNDGQTASTSAEASAMPPPPPAFSAPAPVGRSASQTTLTSLPPTQPGDSFGSNGDDIVRVSLKKGTGGIGLSIVAAQGIGDTKMGIYVKKVVEGSIAASDGRLGTGDQLLAVNGHSLLGISQEDAAKLMTNSGPEVHFDVRKGAAHRNGISAWLNGTPKDQTRVLPAPPPQYVPPSPAMSSTRAPPSYSTDVPANYQQRYKQQQQQQQQPSNNGLPRTSALAASGAGPATAANAAMQQHYEMHMQHHQMRHAPTAVVELPSQSHSQPPPPLQRYFRSNSASDLQLQDPNTSYSQRSITSATHSGFDKLPAHYRHSSRPTVIQPGRPSAPSPAALRRGAQSPVSVGGALYRPSSASNLFAPPRSPTALLGYSSNSARESNQDIYRASMADSPPAAHSSPRDEYRPLPPNYSSYSASLPQPINANSTYSTSRPTSMHGYGQQRVPSTAAVPSNQFLPQSHATNVSNYAPPTSSSSMGYGGSSQEPAHVRPAELGGPSVVRERREWSEERQSERQTTSFGVIRGAVPTAVTQALQLQHAQGVSGPAQRMRPVGNARERGIDADVRQLERTNTAIMSYEAVNDELDMLDMKGINMTKEESRRYRELLNVAAEQSRTRRLASSDGQKAAVIIHHKPVLLPPTTSKARTETLIDDVTPYSMTNGSSLRENISPRSLERASMNFIDNDFLSQDGKRDDIGYADSPGIVGTQEIYRDPRQRRLNEIQEQQQLKTPTSDGASLAFRDKQRLFAQQLGEQGTPKQRVVVSSAQRQIEHDVA